MVTVLCQCMSGVVCEDIDNTVVLLVITRTKASAEIYGGVACADTRRGGFNDDNTNKGNAFFMIYIDRLIIKIMGC
jgi:hypothetical protein